ncbi:MAG: hypothetical protein NTV08_15265 [Verrucomicrobia bacterium]|nr:hypothetical protein [Verrucomicrobiota bacterium]
MRHHIPERKTSRSFGTSDKSRGTRKAAGEGICPTLPVRRGDGKFA